ncbi:MAG: hypothetical protein ACOYXB_03655 [Bacteroidota bacterium]
MEIFAEILKYTIPALIVFLTTWVLLRNWRKSADQARKHEFNMHMNDEILPVRLQAYERIILFLERISPDSILLRINRPEYSSRQLQAELLSTIRQEFEHNLAQQVYISTEAWEAVKTARNQTVKMINDAAEELKPQATGTTLSKLILEKVMELKNPPTQAAIDILKREVSALFF